MLRLVFINLLFISTLFCNTKQNIIIQFDWLHQFQFAGYYIAKEKGYFEKNNLDVELREYKNNFNILEKIRNNSSMYAVGKSSLVLENDLVLINAIFQHSPLVLITTNKDIKNINHLKNKRIMITKDAKLSTSIYSMLEVNHLRKNSLEIQAHTFDINDLINGKTDAMASYISNEPHILDKKGISYKIFDPKDYGFNFYEGILFTSKKEYNKNPKRIEKINNAVLKGWEYAFNNIEETAKLIFEKYNSQNKTLESLIYEGQKLKELSYNENTPLGEIKKEKIEEISKIYNLLGVKKFDHKKVENFIYKKEKSFLNSQELEYLKNNPITFITNNDFEPLTIYENNTLKGIEIDFIKLIEKKIGKKINMKIINNIKEQKEYLRKNINSFKYRYGMYNNIENLIPSKNIYKMNIGLITNNDSAYIENINILEHKTIAHTKYLPSMEEFKKIYKNLNFIQTDTLEEALNLLSQKKVFAVLERIPVATYFINKNASTNKKISGILKHKFNMQFLIHNKNSLLKNIINKAIDKISDDEKFKIVSKYNLVKYETGINYKWIYRYFLPLLCIVFFILFLNRKLQKEVQKRRETEEKLLSLVNTDSLTGIANRRRIEELYSKELETAKRYKTPFSLIFFDVDNFKHINDNFSHKTGDIILTKIAEIINNTIRVTDYFGRWGGDEFIVLLPQTTKIQAQNVIKNIEQNLIEFDYKIENLPDISCSFGVIEYKDGDTYDSLLSKVDNEMYKIKNKRKAKK